MNTLTKFTPALKSALKDAENEARQLGCGSVQPAHLLLAFTRQVTNGALNVLTHYDRAITGEKVRMEVDRRYKAGSCAGTIGAPLPLSGALLDLISRAIDASRCYTTSRLATEHVLIEMMSGDKYDIAARVLESFGLTPQALYNAFVTTRRSSTEDLLVRELGRPATDKACVDKACTNKVCKPSAEYQVSIVNVANTNLWDIRCGEVWLGNIRQEIDDRKTQYVVSLAIRPSEPMPERDCWFDTYDEAAACAVDVLLTALSQLEYKEIRKEAP